MRYENIQEATFLSRPNRFVALVEREGQEERVHVKNTGRCKELLLPGARVYLTEPHSPGRKTRFDLVGVRRFDGRVVNIDSQAPNQVVGEWLSGQDFDLIRPEYTFGDSRLDFMMEREGRLHLLEVKGCTLEIEGIGYFPDAPTQRGIKHLEELSRAAREGILSYLAFVIPMEGVWEVRPNLWTHPEFGQALEQARAAGVKVLHLPCRVAPDSLSILPGRRIEEE